MDLHYLAKTLSRTKRKDYENYVINAIWNRVGNLDLKPVSQQYIDRKDENEGHYFIDLYFPQLNLAIEVDEPPHAGKEGNDKERELAIIDVIRQRRKQGTTFKRIVLYDRNEGDEKIHWRELSDVEQQIDVLVHEIKSMIAVKPLEPVVELSPKEYYRERTAITIDDPCDFSTINEACNTLFGTNYQSQGPKKVYFTPNTFKEMGLGNYKVWFPKLVIAGKAASKGWKNQMTPDGKEIWEVNEKPGSKPMMDFVERVTFARYKDPITGAFRYKFMGVFKDWKTHYKTRKFSRREESFPILRLQTRMTVDCVSEG
jgi:very-short-patch-repair endonuclease